MRVLFVSGGNQANLVNPIIHNQALSLQKCGIEIDHFSIKGKGARGYLANVSILRSHLAENKYDIIHAHFGFSGIVSEMAQKRQNLIVSFMGDDLMGVRNSRGKYTLKGKAFVLIHRWMARHRFSFNIVKTAEMNRKLKSANSEVIPNGVNFEKFKPLPNMGELRKKLGIDRDKKLVIFVSDPKRAEKNFELAQNAHIVLNHENSQLKALHGISQDELVLYYNAADVLLLTSTHEGSPNVVKEAMACNLPVVATDVGDVRELFSDTHGCYLTSFEPSNVASNLDSALKFGQRTNGRDKIRHLDEKLIAEKIISVYNRILNEN